MEKFIIALTIDIILITLMATPMLMELYTQITVNPNIASIGKLIIILGLIVGSLLFSEWKLSFLHEKMHMKMAKHYHPECEYKITNSYFSCSDPKAFSLKEIRVVAASASIVNLLIALLFAAAGFFLFGTGVAIPIIVLSLYNLIVFSDNETTTDGYLIIFPEKFYEVGGF